MSGSVAISGAHFRWKHWRKRRGRWECRAGVCLSCMACLRCIDDLDGCRRWPCLLTLHAPTFPATTMSKPKRASANMKYNRKPTNLDVLNHGHQVSQTKQQNKKKGVLVWDEQERT